MAGRAKNPTPVRLKGQEACNHDKDEVHQLLEFLLLEHPPRYLDLHHHCKDPHQSGPCGTPQGSQGQTYLGEEER
jgi:hypothetical protein